MDLMLQIDNFDSTIEDWAAYIERLEQYCFANDVEDERKVAVLLGVVGAKTYNLLCSLTAPTKPDEKSFKEIVNVLQTHLNPKPLVIDERFRFHKRNQQMTESITEYIAELRHLSQHCQFGQGLSDALRDRLVFGLHNESTQKRLLSEIDLTLARALEIAISMEATAKDAGELQRKSTLVCTMNKFNTRSQERSQACFRCGKKSHDPADCWFKDKDCRQCNKRGHIQKMCKSKQSDTKSHKTGKGEGNVHQFTETDLNDSDEEDLSCLELFSLKETERKIICVTPEVEGVALKDTMLDGKDSLHTDRQLRQRTLEKGKEIATISNDDDDDDYDDYSDDDYGDDYGGDDNGDDDYDGGDNSDKDGDDDVCDNSSKTRDKPYHCLDCGKSFTRVYHLKRHKQTHNKDKSHHCSDCGKSFTRPEHLKKHQRRHMTDKSYHCTNCNERFSKAAQLRSHMKVHAGEKPHLCTDCGKLFQSLHTFERHQQKHTGKMLHQCSDCGKVFTRAYHLRRHQYTHKEKSNHCSDCGKSFTRLEHLKRHQRKHKEKTRYHCSMCEEKFSTKAMLNSHLQIHVGELPHHCSDCGKAFPDKRQFEIHQKRHRRKTVKERSYLCSDCGMTFSKPSAFKVHQRSHTGEKPYSCSECGKSFAQSTTLRIHLQWHAGERASYSCPVCGKTFSRSNSVRRHQMVHTGERPHECPCCGKRCFRRSALIIHMRSHTGEKPYICSECGKRFSQDGDRKRHQIRHHPDLWPEEDSRHRQASVEAHQSQIHPQPLPSL